MNTVSKAGAQQRAPEYSFIYGRSFLPLSSFSVLLLHTFRYTGPLVAPLYPTSAAETKWDNQADCQVGCSSCTAEHAAFPPPGTGLFGPFGFGGAWDWSLLDQVKGGCLMFWFEGCTSLQCSVHVVYLQVSCLLATTHTHTHLCVLSLSCSLIRETLCCFAVSCQMKFPLVYQRESICSRGAGIVSRAHKVSELVWFDSMKSLQCCVNPP